MQPLNTKLLVKPIVPVDIHKDKIPATLEAQVVAVGREVKEVKKGQIVLFSPFGFDEVMENDVKLIVIDESLILATKV